MKERKEKKASPVAAPVPQNGPLTQIDVRRFADLFTAMCQEEHAPACLNESARGPIYYFNYFNAEVKDAQKAQLLEPLNLLFHIERGMLKFNEGLVPEKSQEGIYTFRAHNGADTWKTALKRIMKLGFKAVKTNAADGQTDSMAEFMLAAPIAKTISRDNLGADGGVEYFWRGDDRARHDVIQQDGAKRKIDVGDLAGKLNLDKPWNPFSEPEIKQHMWMRLGQTDNDYNTLISVGLDYRTVVAFPELDDWGRSKGLKFENGVMQSLNKWDQGTIDRLKDNLALVTLNPGGQRICLATKTNVYLLAYRQGAVFNTTEWAASNRGASEPNKQGNRFEERAILSIPKECFAACIPVLRIHHGMAKADGFTCFRVGNDKAEVLTYETLKSRFDKHVANTLRTKLDDAVNSFYHKNLRTAWADTGYADPANSNLKVTKVDQYPISGAITKEDKRLYP